MRALLEKIESDAKTWLSLPTGTQPTQAVARYQKFLRLETHRLKMRHRAGGGGREICRARARVMDLLFRHLLQAPEAEATQPPTMDQARYALVATGGYGRGELNPLSDVDIMFLHDHPELSRTQPPSFMSLLTSGLVWDIGLKVSHAVRTVENCVEEANRNMQSKTALIEARLICGDVGLFNRMQAAVLAKCVNGHEDDYIQARLQDQAARRAKYGDSACMQEPSIKNGCGGLRDYQNLLWMAFFKYRSRTLADLEGRNLIVAQERHELESAYDFLLRVRNELHYYVGRPADALTKSVQPAIARNLGYIERSPSRRLEEFMRDYYRHARNIYLITRTLEQRLALLPQPKRLPSLRRFLRERRQRATYVLDGFKFVDGEVHSASERVFREQPRRLMRAFRCAQQRGLKLNPDLAQLIRNQLDLVTPEFCRDEHVHQTFLEILNQRGNVAPTLRAMHEVGLLGEYLPAFGKLTCLVQHEFYHRYATDEHTLMCLEQLDRVWGAQEAPYAEYARLFQKVERPYLLYLALLLHDSGKATHTSNHAENSSRIALGVAKRLGLDAAATHTLRLLIRHHLAMAQTSQRRDLDDFGEIRRFAGLVENHDHLDLLTLLTFVDSRATSDQLWNSFKDLLLWALYRKTSDLLARGDTEFVRLEAKQRDLLAAEVRALAPAAFADNEVDSHFAKLPNRYYQLRTAGEVITDLELAHRFMHLQVSENDDPLEPVTTWHHESDRGYSQVKVCTWDRHGLFSKIAGALSAAGLNILSAQIFTRNDDIVLDTFLVTDAATGSLANREERERFEEVLRGALTEGVDLGALIRRRKAVRLPYQSTEGERIPTVIKFDNTTSDTQTVIDLETEDRVGLLWALSQAVSEMGLNISLAKICTERGAAIDSFYVSAAGNQKVLGVPRQRQITARLRAAIHGLD